MKPSPYSAVMRWFAPLPMGLLAGSIALSGCGAKNLRTRPLESLSQPDREMLDQYEAVRAALAHDDARLAKHVAVDYEKHLHAAPPDTVKPHVVESVTKIIAANGLEAERESFRAWSAYAITVASNVEGFFVVHCPIPGCGDWLQRNTTVDNPYMGKAMHDCGEVQK